jgi:hypothetical protein
VVLKQSCQEVMLLLLLELDADGDWFFTVRKRIAACLTMMESQVGICSSGVVLLKRCSLLSHAYDLVCSLLLAQGTRDQP